MLVCSNFSTRDQTIDFFDVEYDLVALCSLCVQLVVVRVDASLAFNAEIYSLLNFSEIEVSTNLTPIAPQAKPRHCERLCRKAKSLGTSIVVPKSSLRASQALMDRILPGRA